ncbi:EAL domain-containing protein [Aliivibrio wodanis]|uniref:Phytochrome-like protein cph2 n=1 Tax=Aliivibrio wodanis TaxID=80852 RepID=A0A5Q4YXJ5_9GAMM|nr:Phytochrome-like protein cph2 [Aliivibrio wodanis]
MTSTLNLTKENFTNSCIEKEVSFTWHPSTNTFHIDNNVLEEVLNIKTEINSLEQFLNLFSQEDQPQFNSMLNLLKEGHDTPPIKACMTTGNNMTLGLVSAKKISHDLIAGMVMPLCLSLTKEDMSLFFHQLFENDHHGMIITNDKTQILACNTYFEKISGYTIDELLGKKTSIFNADKHGSIFFKEMWQKVNQLGFWNGVILSKTKSGIAKPQELLLQRITSIKNNTYYLGYTLDLSDKLYRVAGVEHGGIELLTQLPNEQDFSVKVQHLAESLQDSQGLLVISFVPKFNKNNEYESKKQIASALAYYEDNFIAGFLKKTVFSSAIVYHRSKNKPHSLSIYEAIRTRFNTIKERVNTDVYKKITECTIGVSVFSLDASNPQKLISHSLQAMYEHHSSNNSNICFFNRTLHNKVKRRDNLENIVKESILNKSMEVYFQPIISTESWKVCKLEALCRFTDNDGHQLDTEEMVRVAEDLQLVTELDLAIADKSISSREELIKIFGQDIELTINISLNSNKTIKHILHNLISLFKKHRKHLPYITIELTESAYFDGEKKDNNLLFELRKEGIKIAIDDFGTGYSSFSYLKNGNFDLLKIDRDFITNLAIGSHDYHIVKMITALAHTLNVKVVAEGVENFEELSILQDLQIDFIQGFYFEKPQPISRLSSNLNIKDKIARLVKPKREDVDLFILPPQLSPTHTLDDIKNLFDDNTISTLPVIVENKCVGVITRERFSLHITPSLGTDRETMQDYRSLTKVANSMMDATLTLVSDSININEIHEKIRQNCQFPWVGINSDGDYSGIIDSRSIINYLNNQ